MKTKVDSGIYCITNTANGKVYVGSSVNIRARWKGHLHQLRNGKHHSRYLQASWNKHGESVFSFSVLQSIESAGDLLRCEDEWITKLNAAKRPHGYNICQKAGSQLGLKHSEDTRKKLSASLKGKKKTPEHQAAINESLRGRSLSEDCKKKLAAAQRGRKPDEETRQKMREARRDMKKIMSPESYERMVKANVGRKFSEEHRAKIAAANRRRITSDETKAKLSLARKRTEQAKREAKQPKGEHA